MSNKKFRWSKVYESSEEELVSFLHSRNLQARRIAAEEFSEALQQVSERNFTIWCAEGSLVVRQESAATSLQPGDALAIEANTPHDLIAGMTGYVCYITD
jgi:quercetin dioxygenase-like cupin family protein